MAIIASLYPLHDCRGSIQQVRTGWQTAGEDNRLTHMTLSGWLIAWRSLRRRPAFFLATWLILSLGIAANTAVFSVVDATLMKPLPYADPDRLVVVMEGSPKTGREGLI